MASTNNTSSRRILRQSIELDNYHSTAMSNDQVLSVAAMALNEHEPEGDFKHENCDGNHDENDATIKISSMSKIADQMVAPYLAKHIPEQYAPQGQQPPSGTANPQDQVKDPNTKYCYRHRPDSKCRRTADEPTMENLQRVCSLLGASGSCLTNAGTRNPSTIRPAGNISRLGAVLCFTC